MLVDDAFFAHTEIEPLIWTEDPVDRPLLDRVPAFLFLRSGGTVQPLIFNSSRRPKPKTVHISVRRGGKRRIVLPLALEA